MRSLRLQIRDVQPIAARAEVESAVAFARRGETVPLEQWRSLDDVDKGRVDMNRPGFNSGVKREAEKRMQHVDKLPPEVREIVHELGFAVVHAFYLAGIKKPNTIRHLVMLARHQQQDGRPADFGNYRTGSRK